MDTTNIRLPAFNDASLILGTSFILGLGFDFFFYGRSPGIGFPIYMLIIVGGLLMVSSRNGQKADAQFMWISLPLAFFSAMVAVRSNALLTCLNMSASLLLLLLAAELAAAKPIIEFSTYDYLVVALLPRRFIDPMRQTLANAIPDREVVPEDRAVFLQVRRGVLMAAPALFVFILLFSSADLIFQSYVARVVDMHLSGETVLRGLLVVVVALAFTGGFAYALRPKGEAIRTLPGSRLKPIGYIETTIFLGSISALFLFFIVIQFAYFFGGAKQIAIPGVTYADYARRGFFELLAVAVLAFLILWSLDKYVQVRDGCGDRLFRTLGSALITEVLVIMISAFKRLSLYEGAFGFTTLRLYSHVFTLFLGAIFILFFAKILQGQREQVFAFRAFILVVVFLAGMNLLNPDRYIARRNIQRMKATGNLDIEYFARLSDDAVFETSGSLDALAPGHRGFLANEFNGRLRNRSTSPYYTGWQSFNLARRNAKKLLERRLAVLHP